MEPGYPFEVFKAETLRAMCRDLGYKFGRRGAPRRDIMIEFLTSVQEEGVERALEKYSSSATAADPRSPAKSISAPPTSSSGRSSSRKRPVVSDYDTRYKNKRVKSTDAGPRKRGRPRKSSPAPAPEPGPSVIKRGRGRPRKSQPTSEIQSAPGPSRPRGRPRKRPLSPQLNQRSPSPRKKIKPSDDKTTVKRQVFDGILLPDRKFRAAKTKEMSPEIPPLALEEDEILPTVENDIEESSLGGSNKENEMLPEESEAPEAAENGLPTTRALEPAALVLTAGAGIGDGVGNQGGLDEDEDADAEGEHEDEDHIIIRPTVNHIEVTVETTTETSVSGPLENPTSPVPPEQS